jgi:hypothetical protein
MLQKEYLLKLFAPDGATFLATIPHGDGGMKTLPTFQSRINGGLGEMVVDLDMPFDEIDTSIDFMHVAELWVTDEDHPRGRRIYRGFVSRIEPYREEQEGVRVTCLGLVSLLSFAYYKNGTNYAVTHTDADPEAIFQAIITHFGTIYGGSLLSTSGVTNTVGTVVSVTFTDQKWADALRKTVELAGTDWFWKVDADGKCHLSAKPVTATHTLTIGKDVERFTLTKDSERVINDVQVRGDGGNTDDDDATSQATYGTGSPGTGKRTRIIADTSLTSASARTQRAAKEIEDNKDARLSARLTLTPEADLEGILVGQTVNLRNFRKGNTFIADNLLVAATTYRGDRLDLELEQVDADFGAALTAFVG